jgi:hypothetical protein
MEDEEIERCPFCGDSFGLIELTEHAGDCERRSLRAFSETPGDVPSFPPVAAPPTCAQCKRACGLDQLFILDECSCKYHRDCISTRLRDLLAVSVNLVCPSCHKEVSMRDVKELTGFSLFCFFCFSFVFVLFLFSRRAWQQQLSLCCCSF